MNRAGHRLLASLAACVALTSGWVGPAEARPDGRRAPHPVRPGAEVGREAGRTRRVLLLGVDGLRPDALLKADAPAFRGLARGGQVTWDARVPDTTLSGPSWAAFLTGVRMARHGVRNNRFESHRLGETPTFFDHVREAMPEDLLASVVAWQPFQRVLLANRGLDVNAWHASDDDVTADAVGLLTREDPRVLLVHLDAVDAAGHKHGYGPGPGHYRAAIEATDARVGRILKALRQRARTHRDEEWLVLVTTDHGGTGKGHGSNALTDKRIFIIAQGLGRARTAFPRGRATLFDIAPTVLAYLGVDPARYAGLDGRPLQHPARATADATAKPGRSSGSAPGSSGAGGERAAAAP